MAGSDQLMADRPVRPAVWAAGEHRMRGRDHELGQVLDAVRAGAARESRLCFVEGGPGAGRTRLLHEAVRAALGHRFVAVANLATVESRPPGASVSALCTLDAWPAADRRHLIEPPLLDLAALPRWLDERERDGTHSRPGPVLVTVDDLQDCPPGTGRMLSTLCTRPRGYPVTWLFSRVTGQGDTELSRLFSTHGPASTHLELGPVGDDAVAAVAADVLGATPRPAVLALAARAGGNISLLLDLLDGLRDESQVVVRDGAADVVPPVRLPQRVLALVRSRSNQLSPATRRLLRVAAALGPTISPHDLAGMMGESFAALIPAIEEALDSFLLVCTGQRLAFGSELVWWAVAESTPSSVWHALRVEANLRANGATTLAPVQSLREPAPPDPPTGAAWESLSEHERTVSYLVSEGLTNRQVASRIFLSPHTVNYHLRQIFRKLDIKSRVELARYGASHHLRDPRRSATRGSGRRRKKEG